MGTVVTSKFVRKPLYVDAVQVTVENFEDIAAWVMGEVGNVEGGPTLPLNNEKLVFDPPNQYIKIRVHNPQSQRQQRAHVEDWILYTDRGYKIYTDRAFKDNFDETGIETEPEAEAVVDVPTPETPDPGQVSA